MDGHYVPVADTSSRSLTTPMAAPVPRPPTFYLVTNTQNDKSKRNLMQTNPFVLNRLKIFYDKYLPFVATISLVSPCPSEAEEERRGLGACFIAQSTGLYPLLPVTQGSTRLEATPNSAWGWKAWRT